MHQACASRLCINKGGVRENIKTLASRLHQVRHPGGGLKSNILQNSKFMCWINGFLKALPTVLI